jgi:hypothetical protein
MIEKKFTMFSTKEWIQFFQYKLSPEREKELVDRTLVDPFLKEAVDTLSTQDNRPLAFQSLNYLIHQVEEATGVSESNISSSKSTNYTAQSGGLINKTVFIGVAALALLGTLAYGVYYYVSNQSSAMEMDEMTEADTTVMTNSSMADTTARPFDVIPGTVSTPVDTPKPLTPSASNTKKKSSTTLNNSITSPETSVATSSTPSSQKLVVEANDGAKERELFSQAQDKFKAGDRE